MERYLRPERFDTDPQSQNAEVEWLHWKRTLDSFLESVAEHAPNKLNTLINYVSPRIYTYISECTTFDNAVTTLTGLFVKKRNKVYSRHKLLTHKQNGQNLDDFVQELKVLAKNCQQPMH